MSELQHITPRDMGLSMMVAGGKFLIFVDDELEKEKREKGRKKRAKRARENETKGREKKK